LSLYTKALTIPPNTGKDNPKEAKGEAEIIIRGYNEDDTYPHSFICRFEVEPEEVVKVQQQILEEIKALREEIRALREEMVAPAIGAPIILEEILGIGS